MQATALHQVAVVLGPPSAFQGAGISRRGVQAHLENFKMMEK